MDECIKKTHNNKCWQGYGKVRRDEAGGSGTALGGNEASGSLKR